jgi:hypothetical protein
MFQVTDDAARFARGKEYTYAGLKDGSLVPVIDKVLLSTKSWQRTATWSPMSRKARSLCRLVSFCWPALFEHAINDAANFERHDVEDWN